MTSWITISNDQALPNPVWLRPFSTAYFSETRKDKKIHARFLIVTYQGLKWSTQRSDYELYYRKSQKLINLYVWNTHRKFCTSFMCNLYSFQNNRLSTTNVSYGQGEVNIYQYFVLLTITHCKEKLVNLPTIQGSISFTTWRFSYL